MFFERGEADRERERERRREEKRKRDREKIKFGENGGGNVKKYLQKENSMIKRII